METMMNMGRARLPVLKNLFVLLLVASLCLGACGKNRALDRIESSGTITVITRNNAHCYYRYRDQDMGFEYDLAKAFADFLGVELKLKVAESWKQWLSLLNEGEGDLVAASMTITPSRLEWVDFSKGYMPVQQMVITHKKNTDIKSMDDLGGKTIYIRGGTSYEDRLRKLKQAGLDITIKAKEEEAVNAKQQARSAKEALEKRQIGFNTANDHRLDVRLPDSGNRRWVKLGMIHAKDGFGSRVFQLIIEFVGFI